MACALTVLLVASCITSEEALFVESDAVFPIEDGATYQLRSNDETERLQMVRFIRIGHGYALRAVGDADDVPMQIVFVPISQTPEDDYIAQLDFNGGEGEGFVYAFYWPLGDGGYRILLEAGQSDGAGKPTSDWCAASLFGCRVASAEEVRRYYLDVIHPVLASGRPPVSYQDMIPVQAHP